MVNMAMKVNKPALILPTESPKFNKPTPNEPKITVKFNHDKNVLSLAKKTFGSTLAGNAILLLLDMISFIRSTVGEMYKIKSPKISLDELMNCINE